MNETDSVYSIFKTLAKESISNIFTEIIGTNDGKQESNKLVILAFQKKNFGFFRRALPQLVFEHKEIQKIMFFESLTETNTSGKLIGLCLDDTDEVDFALNKFSLLQNYEKYLIMIPRLSTVCQEKINQSGFKVHVIEYPLEVVSLEDYCFVVPSPKCFMRCFVENDINDVYTIANSLLKIILMTGCPDKILSAGDISCRVFTLLNQLKSQVGESFFNNKFCEFNQIFIIDRTADLLTPLASQFYYGGILDEVYNVDYGYLQLPKEVVLDEDKDKREVLLSDRNDEFFSNLRGQTIIDASDQAEKFRHEILEIKDKMNQTTGTVKFGFYARRAQHLADKKQYLFMHYELLEQLIKARKPMKEMIDFEYNALMQDIAEIDIVHRLINRKKYWDAIRLFSFASVATRGLSKQNLIEFQRRIVSSLGFDVLSDLINLQKAGLITSSLSLINQLSNLSNLSNITALTNIATTVNKPKFSAINSVLKVLLKNTPDQPDIEKGYDKYVPIIARLVQEGVKGQWEGETPVSKLMQQMELPVKIDINKKKESISEVNGKKKILVFIIGGVTSTEIQLFKQMGSFIFNDEYEFHVGSTSITYGEKLIKSICPVIKSIIGK